MSQKYFVLELTTMGGIDVHTLGEFDKRAVAFSKMPQIGDTGTAKILLSQDEKESLIWQLLTGKHRGVPKETSKFYRRLTVHSALMNDLPDAWMGLPSILEECDTGHMVGTELLVLDGELTSEGMHEALLDHGNDGEFFRDDEEE